MIKKTYLSIFLVVFLFSINTYNIYAQTMKMSEHEYVEVYEDFISTKFDNEIPNSKTALLYDLDNDEYDELITFYVSDNYQGDGFVEYNYEVFDLTNNKLISCSYSDNSGYDIDDSSSEAIYISKNGYIIHQRYAWGYIYSVLQYDNGKLNEVEKFNFYTVPEVMYYHSDIATNESYEITSEDFTQLYVKYGVDFININKVLNGGNNDYYSKIEREVNEIPFKFNEGNIKATNDAEEIQKLYSLEKIDEITVFYNNKQLVFEMPIINYNDRVYYPFRELLESLGAVVSWDSDTLLATGEIHGESVQIKANENFYYNNGIVQNFNKGENLFIYNARMYVPIKSILESLGFTVTWNGENRSVIIK